jgi:regulator of sirC expression with transglutaminase-like and TPR domain
VVKYDDRSRVIFVDPYHEGRVLNRQGCTELVKTLHGRPVDLHDLHFAAVENRTIVLRMLNNLRAIYVSARRHRRALEVLETGAARKLPWNSARFCIIAWEIFSCIVGLFCLLVS